MNGKKLGLRPANLERMAKTLKLSRLFKGVVPEHPLLDNHFAKAKSEFQMYGNDKYGDCGPAALCNQRGLVTTYLSTPAFPTLSQVYTLYSQSSNPPFDPTTGANDNGVVLQDMLEAAMTNGVGGIKPVAFANVNATNLNEISAAIAIFGSVILGVELRIAQQNQTNEGTWRYVSNSPIWGGHAIIQCGYNHTNVNNKFGIAETWGQRVNLGQGFMKNQVSECWVVIWPENLGTVQFQNGISLDNLKTDYLALTGKTLVVP